MKKLLIVFVFLLNTSVAWSAEYKFIVPNAPGGGASDTVARKLSQMYQARFGDSLLVLNIVGGQGIPAIERFKQERLAVTIVISGQMVYNYLDDNLKLDYSDKDFNIISPVSYTANIITTRADSPIKDINDLSKFKNPIIGSWQVQSDMTLKSFANHFNQNLTLVRYRDPTFMSTDVISGILPVGTANTGSVAVLELVNAGKLRILASSAPFDFKFNNVTVPSINKKYNIPQFDNLVWLSISPGQTNEHLALAKNLKTLIDTKEFQDYIKELTLFPVPKETIPPNESPARLRNHVLKYKYFQDEIK